MSSFTVWCGSVSSADKATGYARETKRVLVELYATRMESKTLLRIDSDYPFRKKGYNCGRPSDSTS